MASGAVMISKRIGNGVPWKVTLGSLGGEESGWRGLKERRRMRGRGLSEYD
jgi:hypothetical protein